MLVPKSGNVCLMCQIIEHQTPEVSFYYLFDLKNENKSDRKTFSNE
jgi:hypothetical protein